MTKGDIVRFRENADTISAGHITRVWAKPAGDPYVSIKSEGRTFVRCSSAVTPGHPECELHIDVNPDEAIVCGERSRFRVERDPADESYPGWESCEEHLGTVIAALLEGRDDVRAIVTVHWGWV